jgi:hypothetical protein
MKSSRTGFEGCLDRRSPAEKSIVLRYRNGLGAGMAEEERALYQEWLGRTSLGEGARIFPLLEYKGVEICVLDETSLMFTKSLKSIDGCITVARCKLEGLHRVAFESGGNTGEALTVYGLNAGLETFCFVPEENLCLLDSKVFTSEKAHLISVQRPSQVKGAAALFEKTTGVPRVPRRDWRYEASMCRGFFILESMQEEGGFDWLAQTISAGFGPIGIYRILGAFSREGGGLPRFLGVQQEANCPMYRAWKGLPARDEAAAADTTGGLLTRVMYDQRPHTYGTYGELEQVLRSTGGDLNTVSHAEFEEFLDARFDGRSILDLLGDGGIQIAVRNGKILDKTGLAAIAGTIKQIDALKMARKSRVLCCLTSGAGAADGGARPERTIADQADLAGNVGATGRPG